MIQRGIVCGHSALYLENDRLRVGVLPEKGADMAQWLYLPVIARQDWVAVLNNQGQIQGFLRGDGF